jgi:hypothetical protein
MRRRLLVLALGVAPLFALARVAHAKSKPARLPARPLAEAPEKQPEKQPETLLEVSVLHGTQAAKDNDARIGDLPELREGPFAKYTSYQLLSRTELALSKGGKRELKLPNGRRLEARLEDRLPDGSSRLVASINRPDAKDFLPLLEVKARPGQKFIVAGQSYKRGILVLVFKVLR